MISISVKGLTKRFGKTTALNKIDLVIEPGELFFLLGPSGCGKTTLLRSIAGFYNVDEGAIHFDDKDVTTLAPHKRNTGMVFQSYALWPHMTVAQNVAFGLKERKVPKSEIKERVGKALESVRMEGYGDRKPNELSGGQQQRVALARALVLRPNCLLLDEPLSNLDAKLRNEMRLEIRRVCKEHNLTTVYVTHDQKEALSIADRIAVLEDGKIHQVGTPQELYRRPKNKFVAHFIGETNFVEGKVIDVGGGMCSIETQLGLVSGVLPGSTDAPAIGEIVHAAIRPECLNIETFPTEENCFKGKMGSTTYFGEVAQYEFLCDGLSLKVYGLNPKAIWGQKDKDFYVWADAEDVVILKS